MCLGKIRRNGMTFLTWIGDHSPKHVHVYVDNRLVVKWDLENNKIMKGKMSAKILAEINQLKSEGKL